MAVTDFKRGIRSLKNVTESKARQPQGAVSVTRHILADGFFVKFQHTVVALIKQCCQVNRCCVVWKKVKAFFILFFLLFCVGGPLGPFVVFVFAE